MKQKARKPGKQEVRGSRKEQRISSDKVSFSNLKIQKIRQKT